MTYKNDMNPTQNDLVYSFMGLRIIFYTLFTVLNLFQTIVEIRKILKKKPKTTTRFFVFLFMGIFCMFRDIQTAFFYDNPDLGIGTPNFFFFSLGTAAIFLTWVFIQHYWLLIMYKFFISDEVRLNRSKPINYTTFVFSAIIIIYQFIVSSITLHHNIDTIESVGFLILLLIYAGTVLFNGYYLLRHLKIHKKTTPFKHFDVMILKTKILLATVIFVVVLIIVQELVFNMYYTDTYDTPRQYLKLFVVGVVESIQMFVVMLVLSDGDWKCYILFKGIKINKSDSSSEMENSKERKKSNVDSISIEINLENSASSKRNQSNSDLLRSNSSFNNSFNNNSSISISIDQKPE